MATATPLDLPERSKPRARGRLQLILILLVVLGPMILATCMYKLKFWVPEGRSYHGAMIGNGESRADIGIAGEDPRWQLLVTAPGACAEDCQRLVYLVRQIQVGLGRDAGRASHALATAQSVSSDYQALLGGISTAATLSAGCPALPAEGRRTRPATVDCRPHGNLVLRYDGKVNGKHVLDDLRHLLKLSNIG